MKYSIKTILGGLMVLALISSCNKDDDSPEEATTPESNMIMINSAETDQGGLEVMVFADDSLTSAYTKVYIKVKDIATNTYITNADVSIVPMMDMGTMMHSAPVENPVSSIAVDDMFEGAVVFIMPGEMGWTLNVDVYDIVGDRAGTATVPVKVNAPAEPMTRMVTPLDGSENLVISYLQPTNPKIGVNDMEITLHKRASMMSFPPVDNYTVHIRPEMVAMGHGSPNNVDPISSGMGHYAGKVNFTMSGNWRINLTIMNGATVVDSTTYFDITF